MKSVFCLALVLFGRSIFSSAVFDEASLYTPPVSPTLFDMEDASMGEDAKEDPPCVVRIALEALSAEPIPEDLPPILHDLQTLSSRPVPSTEAITEKILGLVQRLAPLRERVELLSAYDVTGSIFNKHHDVKKSVQDSHTDMFFEFSNKHLRMFQFAPTPTPELLCTFVQMGAKHLIDLFKMDYDLMKMGEMDTSPKKHQIKTQLFHIKKSFDLVNIRMPYLTEALFRNYPHLYQDLVRIDFKDPTKAHELDVPLFVRKGRYLFEGTIEQLMTPTTDLGYLQIKHRIQASAWDYDNLTLRYEELTDGVPDDLKTLVFKVKTSKLPEE